MPPNDDKALIASSEFDTTQFVKGMDAMTASITAFMAKEDELNKRLGASTTALTLNNKALKDNQTAINALDKNTADYQQNLQRLTAQQTTLQQQNAGLTTGIKQTRAELGQISGSVNTYKEALNNITAAAQKAKAAGTNLFDVAGLSQRVQQITAMASQFRDVFQGKIDNTALDQLEEKLAGTSDEFEQLREVIAFVEDKLKTLDPNSQEFTDLTEVVATGKDVLEQFAGVQEQVNKNSTTLTGRLKVLKNELSEMTLQGKQGTEEFKAIQKEAAHLQDAIDKAGERVRTFSNDFRLIQGGVEALRGIAAGFELAEGTAALFGVKSGAIEESIKRLNAIMAIANGLQEISNLLKKESVVRLVAEEVATKAYTISQRILAVTLGSTAAASKGLAAALAATGIGALVVGIGLIISAITEWASATEKMAEEQENLNVAIEQGNRDNALFIAGIDDANKKIDEGILIRQTANEKIGKGDLAALKQRIANNAEIRKKDEELLQQQIEQAKRFEEAQIARGDKAQEQLDRIARGEEEASDKFIEALKKTVDEVNKATDTRVELETRQEFLLLRNQRDGLRDRNELKKLELAQTEDFLKRLEELRRKLLDAQNKGVRQDANQLAKQANDALQTQLRQIDTEVRKGALSRDRGNALKAVLRQINGVELETELKEFGKKSVAAQQQLENQIFDLRLAAGQGRVELLRDQLEREAALVEVNFKTEFNKLEVARDELLTGVRDAFDQGLISPGQFQRNSDRIKAIYVDLFENLTQQTRRKQEELARLAFERSNELVQQLFAPSLTGLTEATTKELVALTKLYTGHQITFEKYQRELTKITKRESQRRIDLQITENEELLAGAKRRLDLEADPGERAKLEARILELRNQIALLRRQLAEGNATGAKADHDEIVRRVQLIASYAQAIGSVVDNVVGFWQKANEAEAKSLDRSIALQEQRVAAATRIAERGNAEYLRLEEDRLNELRIKQENNARRQLAINAVLQGSQALVAFTAALAQGISTGGPLGGIAIAAAVLGLLASGYAIITSLQAQSNGSQKLFKGTRSVQRRNGEPSGRDTVPAMLTEREAVLPVELAEAYRPTVDAMFDGQVPASAMNRFVMEHSSLSEPVPALNYARMAEAADVHVSYDGRLVAAYAEQTKQLRETNDKLDSMNKHLKHMGVSVVVDKHGLALSVMNLIMNHHKQKRV